jgi:hypothetical protein
MLIKSVLVIVLSLLAVGIFFLGMYYGRTTIGEANKYVLKEPLVIQWSPKSMGKIPSGVILYEYKHLPEISRYYMFVNIKDVDKLEQYQGNDKYNLISGVDAYTE